MKIENIQIGMPVLLKKPAEISGMMHGAFNVRIDIEKYHVLEVTNIDPQQKIIEVGVVGTDIMFDTYAKLVRPATQERVIAEIKKKVGVEQDD